MIEIAEELEALAARMLALGAEMEFFGGFNAHLVAHGRELVGAGLIASDWAKNLREEANHENP